MPPGGNFNETGCLRVRRARASVAVLQRCSSLADNEERVDVGEGDAAGGLEVDQQSGFVADAEASPSLPSAALAALAVGVSRARGVFGPQTGTSAELWQLAWPVMLSQVMVTVLGLVDIAMVGRLGANELAAAGYATQLLFLGQSALFAVGFSCVAIVARAIGAGRRDRARHAHAASLIVAVATAVAIAGAVLVNPRWLLGLLNADEQVIDLAIPYLRMIMVSTVMLAVSLTMESAMRADRDTMTPLLIALLVTVVKVLLNLGLIFGMFGLPRMELVGAGVATLVAQALGVLLFIGVARRASGGSPMALTIADFRECRGTLREVARIAVPGIGERVQLNLALLVYFAVLGHYGTVAVAAYTVGVRVLAFSWIPGTGLAAAVATLVGQSLGAGDVEQAERAGWRAARLSLMVAVVVGAVGALARQPLAEAFTDDPATLEILVPFMLCVALAQPLLQLHFTLGGAHRGAGDTMTPMLAAAAGNWLLRVPLAILFSWGLGLGIVWVWAALVFDHALRAVWLLLTFKSGSWKTARA
jgi:putative MATE family efflux protein